MTASPAPLAARRGKACPLRSRCRTCKADRCGPTVDRKMPRTLGASCVAACGAGPWPAAIYPRPACRNLTVRRGLEGGVPSVHRRVPRHLVRPPAAAQPRNRLPRPRKPRRRKTGGPGPRSRYSRSDSAYIGTCCENFTGRRHAIARRRPRIPCRKGSNQSGKPQETRIPRGKLPVPSMGMPARD